MKIASSRKKLTIFFSDIADFTATTDDLESEELTVLLNHYLTEMSEIALAHGATIDKYIGDAILAFFGDPETRGVEKDAIACVDMAIAMQRRMRELQAEYGCDEFIGYFNAGGLMDPALVRDTMSLFAKEVMPHCR